MAIRGLGTKAKITTKITAPQMAKFFTNSSSMIPTSADVFFFFFGWDVVFFFFRGNPGWEDFPGCFSEKESGTGDYGVVILLVWSKKRVRKCSVAKEGLGKQYEEN